ncbi:hypothetical protein [Algirhabdus cladophorae]|uniref:hypothetical protein n=1 Tax=Algirhabdus cladophorae TaxID=3377108 RepID=UPI003B84722C
MGYLPFHQSQGYAGPMLIRALFFGLMLACASCTQFPELDETVSKQEQMQDFPSLVPLKDITTAANAVSITPDTTKVVQDRLERLQAKADRLRGPVLTRRERDRLAQSIAEAPEKIETLFPPEVATQ